MRNASQKTPDSARLQRVPQPAPPTLLSLFVDLAQSSRYISTINKRKTYIELIILLVVFGTLFTWLSMRSMEEQRAMDRMGREADAYFDSIQAADSIR